MRGGLYKGEGVHNWFLRIFVKNGIMYLRLNTEIAPDQFNLVEGFFFNMSIASNKQKGKDLENYVAELLSKVDNGAVRQIGSGSGKAKGDIRNSLGWTFECKNTKKFDWKGTAEQVKREAMGYQKEVIVWHPPQKPLGDSIAIINIGDFIELLADREKNKGREEILDKYQVKTNLDRAIFHLKNVVKEL